MEYVLLSIVALLASVLTFFSGFGLGTILTPAFALFFPVEIAIALTGVVHFLNNIFKLFLVGKHADKEVLIRFGIPAVLAAFAGAWLLTEISSMNSLYDYTIGNKQFYITPVKLCIALLLIVFALMELLPTLEKMKIGKDKLPLGGVLSGFFGGLSGNQGALRSAFLVNAGLSKEAFIATGVVIACCIDITRLSVYSSRFLGADLQNNLVLVIVATLSAFAGAFIGNKLLKKITLTLVQKIVAVLLILIALGMATGVL